MVKNKNIQTYRRKYACKKPNKYINAATNETRFDRPPDQLP